MKKFWGLMVHLGSNTWENDHECKKVEGMEFDGKQKILNQLQQGQTMFAQMQQMGQQMQMQSAQMEKMAAIIEKLTGQSLVGTAPGHGTSGTPSPTM